LRSYGKKKGTQIVNFEFQKRRQLFVRTHNETFSVVAMRVSIEACERVK